MEKLCPFMSMGVYQSDKSLCLQHGCALWVPSSDELNVTGKGGCCALVKIAGELGSR